MGTTNYDWVGLTEGDLSKAHSALFKGAVDDGDLYFESSIRGSAFLDEGVVKRTSLDHSQGVGCRAVFGEKTGYAYTNSLDLKEVLRSAKTANAIGNYGRETGPVGLRSGDASKDLYPVSSSDLILYGAANPVAAVDGRVGAEYRFTGGERKRQYRL